MNRIRIATALLLIPNLAWAAPPKVSFTYAGIFDRVCSKQTNYQIDPAWVAAVRQRLPDLRSKWGASGVQLLETAMSIVGKPFRQSEFEVSLSVCSFPSMSDPLMVNMRYSLAAFTPTPLSPDVTNSIIFHEIIHKYLRGKVPETSALLEKYKNEDDSVLSHLHLLALQKAVYLKLNQNAILQDVIKKDQSLPNPVYRRAWEIVNDKEDFNAFVTELQP